MRGLRTKTMIHESCPEGALVYRKPSRRRADPRRDRWRRGNLAFPHGAGVRRRDGAVGDALRACATPQRGGAGARRRRARYPYPGAGRGLRLSRSIHPRVPRPFRGHARNGPQLNASYKLTLQEAIVMDSTIIDNLQAPRFATSKLLLVAGLGERYNWESGGPAIPGQWQRFHQSVARIPGRLGQVAYGVCCTGDAAGTVDYIAARAV